MKSSNGTQVPLSTFTHFEEKPTPLAINHQGQFPAVTISFNLAPGKSIGDAVDAVNKAKAELNMPPSVNARVPGVGARRLRLRSTNEPLLILAALIVVYIVLGVLYESYIHPITILSTLPSAGVGAILALLLFHVDLSVIALIGIILLIGIVKKNAIMMIDFALEAEREQGMDAGGGDLSGLPAAVPADHDDDDGGAAGRAAAGAGHGNGKRAAPAAGHHDCRRIDRVAGADAVYDAGGVSVLRPDWAQDLQAEADEELRDACNDGGLMQDAGSRELEEQEPRSCMHFSAPFIRRPVATFLLSIAMILAGAVAYTLLPVASLPQVEYPVISVGASLPGADPETMASAVATPLERQFCEDRRRQ